MFYSTEKNDHGLPYNPYKSIVVPRPIGWISSLDTDGNVNLAPYSQFNNLGYDPPYVMFSASYKNSAAVLKDSVANIIQTGEFVCNMATYELRDGVQTRVPRTIEAVLPKNYHIFLFLSLDLNGGGSRVARGRSVAADPCLFLG